MKKNHYQKRIVVQKYSKIFPINVFFRKLSQKSSQNFPKIIFPQNFPKIPFPKKFSQNYTKNIVKILRKIYWKFFPKKNEPSILPGQKPRPKSHFWDTLSGIILSEGEGRDRTHPQQPPQGGKVLAGIKSSVQAVSKAEKNKKTS